MSNGVKDLNGVSIIGPEDPPKEWNLLLLLDEQLPAHDIALPRRSGWRHSVRVNIASIHGLMIVDTTAH